VKNRKMNVATRKNGLNERMTKNLKNGLNKRGLKSVKGAVTLSNETKDAIICLAAVALNFATFVVKNMELVTMAYTIRKMIEMIMMKNID
jgi:RNA-binding protein YhbY